MVFDDTEIRGFYVTAESKYGFGSASGLLHLSLLRGSVITQTEVESTGIESLNNQYADIGKHNIRIAIGAYHSELRRDEQPAALADAVFLHSSRLPRKLFIQSLSRDRRGGLSHSFMGEADRKEIIYS